MSQDLRIGTPKKGKGERNMDCNFYGACLDFAAKKDWKDFHCDKCRIENNPRDNMDSLTKRE
jgi:hypothetical protein